MKESNDLEQDYAEVESSPEDSTPQEKQNQNSPKNEQTPKLVGTKRKFNPADEDEILSRSIFVKNVDYSSQSHELEDYFLDCGAINRVTIKCDKQSGKPLGYAYVEFATREGANKARHKNGQSFKGRELTVMPKRKNKKGFSSRQSQMRSMMNQ